MTVYADILFIVNLYVDALLLSLVRRFLRLELGTARWLFASVLGGVFGLAALLPDLRGFPLLLLITGQAIALTCAAFAPKPVLTLAKGSFLLLLSGAALSGLLALIGRFLPLRGVYLANGAVYLDISAPALVLLTCLSYGVLLLFERLFRKREPDVLFAEIELGLNGKTVRLPAKIDTGLTLCEPFSGLPVIVCERKALGDFLPPGFGGTDKPFPGLRLVPFSSLGADGVLPAFRPEHVLIRGAPAECYVAVSDRPLSGGSFSALISASLVTKQTERGIL